jgi:hypothetical protein
MEGHFHRNTGLGGGSLERRTAPQNNQVSERNFLTLLLCSVECGLNFFEDGQDLRELGGLIDFPIFLRSEANACPVSAATFVAPSEG